MAPLPSRPRHGLCLHVDIVFLLPSRLRHCLCLVFPLPSRLRHCLYLHDIVFPSRLRHCLSLRSRYGYCHPSEPKSPCCSDPSLHADASLSPHYILPANYTARRQDGPVPGLSDLPPLRLPRQLMQLKDGNERRMWEAYLALVYGRSLTPAQVAR